MNRTAGIVLAAAVAGAAGTGGGVALAQSDGSPLVGILHPRGAMPLRPQSPATYSERLKQICARAVLFEGTHSIGTRAGAIAVARDIRISGGKRLTRADAVPKPPGTQRLAKRWMTLERRLTEMYANNYVRIWYAIERAHTPDQRALLPAVLRALIDQPQRLERQAATLEAALNVPDCTGGSSSPRRVGGHTGSAAPPPA